MGVFAPWYRPISMSLAAQPAAAPYHARKTCRTATKTPAQPGISAFGTEHARERRGKTMRSRYQPVRFVSRRQRSGPVELRHLAVLREQKRGQNTYSTGQSCPPYGSAHANSSGLVRRRAGAAPGDRAAQASAGVSRLLDRKKRVRSRP